jgi:hypothetical protein
MGFWSGLCLVRPKKYFELSLSKKISKSIMSTEFYRKNVTSSLSESEGLISLGDLNESSAKIVIREPHPDNSEPFVPCSLAVHSQRFQHVHLEESFFIKSDIIEFSGMGYPFPWDIEKVLTTFSSLEEFDNFAKKITSLYPAHKELSSKITSHKVFKQWCRPAFNGWHWHVYGT